MLIGIVALDQILKAVFTDKNFTLINKVLSISYKQNTGAAWSLLEGHVVLLSIITLIFLMLLVTFDHFFKEKRKEVLRCISIVSNEI